MAATKHDAAAAAILRECCAFQPGDWTVDDVAANTGVPRAAVGAAASRLRRSKHLLPAQVRLLPSTAAKLAAGKTVEDAIGWLPSGEPPEQRHVDVVRLVMQKGPMTMREIGAALAKSCADGSVTTALQRTVNDLSLVLSPVTALWLTPKGMKAAKAVKEASHVAS